MRRRQVFHIHIYENIAAPRTGGINWQEKFDAIREQRYDGWLRDRSVRVRMPEIAAATKIWRRNVHR